MALDNVTVSGTYRGDLCRVTFERGKYIGKSCAWRATVDIEFAGRFVYDLDRATRPGMAVATQLVKDALGVKKHKRGEKPTLRLMPTD